MAAWEDNVAIDIDAEKQHLVSQNEYQKKLIIGREVFPDPFTIKQKDWTGENEGLQNWPPVYYNDIERFLVSLNMSNDLLHRLDCDYKEGKGFRYFATCFVKEVFWHKISDSSPYCFLKCKVTPSQRTSATPHNVWSLIQKANPGGKVLNAYCSCTAGLMGSCNHVTAMLFRVEAAVSSGVTKPTCTSRLAAWNVPRGSKTVFDMKPICEIDFLKHTYRKRGSTEEAKHNRESYNIFSPSYDKDLKKISNGDKVRNDIYNAFKDCAGNSRFVELIECKKKRPKPNEIVTAAELPNNIITEGELFYVDHANSIDDNVQKFTEKIKLSTEQIRLIYNATKSQSDSEVWFAQRKGRITASKFYNVFTRINTLNKNGTNEFPVSLVTRHLTDQKFESIQTKHGIAMEVHAKEKVKVLFKKSHKKVSFQEPGMVVFEKYPFIAASPDLEVECGCCGKSLVEIKCPYSICESIPTSGNLSYLEKVNENTKLKENTLYYAQIQGQLAVTSTTTAWFFVYTHHGYHIEKIMFNQKYWELLLCNLIQFWNQYLAPVILKLKEIPVSESEIVEAKNLTTNTNSVKRAIQYDNTGPSNTSNQLMLFNQKKQKKKKIRKQKIPVLPKLYLCGHCKRNCIDNPENFKENSIGCTKCKSWYHFACVDINSDDDVPSKNVRWLCMKCV